MNKVIYVGPLVNERYKGGIMRIAEYISEESSLKQFKEEHIQLQFFNSHILTQSKNSEGKFTLENLRQAVYLLYRLIRLFRNSDFDILHFNSSAGLPLLKDQIIIFIVSIFTSKKIFFQIHFSGIKETFSESYLLRNLHIFFLSRNYKVILLSDDFKNQLLSVGFPESKLCVLYNFHNLGCYSQNYLNKVSDVIELAFVGSICKRKGFMDLLFVLSQSDIKYRLNVLGEFANREIEEIIENYITKHNLNVCFHGYLDGLNKNQVIGQSDILILPSYSEGFPMVIPEAMALGCAIISTKIAGIPEIVVNGVNGFLLRPGDIDGLKNKLAQLYFDRELLESFKSNSTKLSSNYTLNLYIEKLSNIYLS